MFRAYPSFGCPFSQIFRELTGPWDRKYIAGVVKGEVSAAEAGIRGASGKANSYSSRFSRICPFYKPLLNINNKSKTHSR